MTGSAELLTISPCLSLRHLLKRGPSFGLRLATRFPSAPRTAKHLAIGQCAINVMTRTLREVGASLTVRDAVPDGRNPACEHSSSPRRQLQPYSLFRPSRRTGIKAPHPSRIFPAYGVTHIGPASSRRHPALVR